MQDEQEATPCSFERRSWFAGKLLSASLTYFVRPNLTRGSLDGTSLLEQAAVTTSLDDVDPVMVGRLDRASFDLDQRLGWTWYGYSRTSATYAEQAVLWRQYQDPPHWPTAANPAAVGYTIELRGKSFTQRGSLHMPQADRDYYAQAVDIQWPGASTADRVVRALAAAPILAEHGLGFPIAGEYWHCQWHDWSGEYKDNHELDATATKDDDMKWHILAPAGTTARFIAPMSPLPDGTLAALYCTWLSTGAAAAVYVSHGVTELAIGVEDLANVTLLGPLPTGDVREWTAADFLAVT